MEVEEVPAQQQPCKFPRIGNGGRGSSNSALLVSSHNPDEESEDRGCQQKRAAPAGGGIEAGGGGGGGNRLTGWHHSRIIRVSRASGGKDRHSKVWTSKGLRDRRVRLSVTTAIQFYDLQDRLGYDQPSKAVEWLIKAAQDAISELPSLNASFPDTPKQLSDERRQSDDRRFDSVELDADGDPNYHHQHVNHHCKNNNAISKSGCSSTSETSKGSGGLTLSRSDVRVNRVKARERARDRAAKEKEKENTTNNNNRNNDDESSRIAHAMSQNPSFTELLTGGIGGGSSNSPNGHHHQNPNGEPINLFHKAAAAQQPMDYFGSGLLGLSSTSGTRNHLLSGFHSLPQTMFSLSGHHQHPETMQHLSYVPDYIPVTAANGGEYNLNFSISSSSSSGGLAGFNRGTLQSNITSTTSSSPSLLPHFQRYSPLDGSSNVNVPFFIGAAAAAAAAVPTMETHGHNHHQHLQFPAGLQLYGDGSRHSDTKGKAKN